MVPGVALYNVNSRTKVPGVAIRDVTPRKLVPTICATLGDLKNLFLTIELL